MNKTINTFNVVVKDGVIQQIGRSYILQPDIKAADKKDQQQDRTKRDN